MRRYVPPFVVLAVVTWCASLAVARVTRSWLEGDVTLCAALAVRGAPLSSRLLE